MGQKTNPIGNRLGIIRGWESNWYGGNDYGDKLAEDDKIRKYVFVYFQLIPQQNNMNGIIHEWRLMDPRGSCGNPITSILEESSVNPTTTILEES